MTTILRAETQAAPAGRMTVYIGTYTGSGSVGIYFGGLDAASGRLTIAGAVAAERPSYVATDPHRRFLYAVCEVGGADHRQGGVSAYALDSRSGQPTFLNSQLSGGTGPCHLSVDPWGQFVLVANYMSGSVALLPIRPDGSLDAATDVVQHRGSGVNPARQEGPHAHSITPDPAGRYALAADLGTDAIYIYAIDRANGKLMAHGAPCDSPNAGAGPRHLAFDRAARHVYVVNELDSTVTVWSYDAAHGKLHMIQTASALPAEFAGISYAADLHLHPSGRFLYASNRGHDSMAVFAVDSQTGCISLQDAVSTRGRTPRGFAIDPDGAFLAAANQDSNTLEIFAIDASTGLLTHISQSISVPNPACVKIFRSPA